MDEQRSRARAARAKMGEVGWDDKIADLLANMPITDFVGYDTLKAEAKVLAVISGQEQVEALAEPGEGIVVLDTTPFYGEGGGQVGDIGTLSGAMCRAQVLDTKKTADGKYYHIIKVCEGELKTDDVLTAEVDADYRAAVSRNHSVTHLLQKALRNRFGTEVGQAGSLVEAGRMRFDFTLTQPITQEDLQAVELEVNQAILKAMPVEWKNMPIADAKALGAMAISTAILSALSPWVITHWSFAAAAMCITRQKSACLKFWAKAALQPVCAVLKAQPDWAF